MKRLTSILAAMLFMAFLGPVSHAQEKGRDAFYFGLEWGYSATILDAYHYNYVESVDGYRVDEKGCKLIMNSNGNLLLKGGIHFSKHIATELMAGWAGIKQGRQVVPILLKETYSINRYNQDGWLVFLTEGVGLRSDNNKHSLMSQAGTGYRIALSRRGSMDFLCSLQLSTDHPNVKDNNTGTFVPAENLRKSDSIYTALNFSISLNF